MVISVFNRDEGGFQVSHIFLAHVSQPLKD